MITNTTWSDFDDAWSEAVQMPVGWRLRSLARNGVTVEITGVGQEYVEWWEATARGPEDQEVTKRGNWPVHALHVLVQDLAQRV